MISFIKYIEFPTYPWISVTTTEKRDIEKRPQNLATYFYEWSPNGSTPSRSPLLGLCSMIDTFRTYQNIIRTKRNITWIFMKNITMSDTPCNLQNSKADRTRRSWWLHLVALMKTSLSPSSTRTTMEEPHSHKTTNITQRSKIVWMWISGQSARCIAQETHTSVSTVYRWIRRWEREGSVSTKPRNERTVSAWGRCIAKAMADQNNRHDFRGGNQLDGNIKEMNM